MSENLEGCKTYRKSLAQKGNGESTPVKRTRSLKQRVSILSLLEYCFKYTLTPLQCYERRAKAVKNMKILG